MENTMVFFLLSAVLAEVIGTIAGFGATTILVPLSSFFLPLKEAIVLVAAFHFFGTLWRTFAFSRNIDWKITLLFGIPSLMGSALGAFFLAKISVFWISKLLGIALIIYALNALLKSPLRLPKKPIILTAGGGIIGFLAGLIGTAGALRGAFFSSWKLKKEIYLGTSAAVALGADLIRVFVYQNIGLLKLNLFLVITLAVTALLGTLLGKAIVGKIRQEVFAKIIFVALILAGLKFLS